MNDDNSNDKTTEQIEAKDESTLLNHHQDEVVAFEHHIEHKPKSQGRILGWIGFILGVMLLVCLLSYASDNEKKQQATDIEINVFWKDKSKMSFLEKRKILNIEETRKIPKKKLFGLDDFSESNHLLYSSNLLEYRNLRIYKALEQHLNDYSVLPANVRQKMNMVFMTSSGLVDMDIFLEIYGNKQEAANESMLAKAKSQELMLNAKLHFRHEQLVHLHEISERKKQRRIELINKMNYDVMRQAKLEKFIHDGISHNAASGFQDTMFDFPNPKKNELNYYLNHILTELKSEKISPDLKVHFPKNIRINSSHFHSDDDDDDGANQKLASLVENLYTYMHNKGMKIDEKIIQGFAECFYKLGDDEQCMTMIKLINGNSHELLIKILQSGYENYVPKDYHLRNPNLAREIFLSGFSCPVSMFFAAINREDEELTRLFLLDDYLMLLPKQTRALPLSWAIQHGNAAIEQLLLSMGADPDLVDMKGRKAAEYRAYGEYWQAFKNKDYARQKEILDAGLDVNIPWNAEDRLAAYALRKKDEQALKLLLDAGADPNWQNLLVQSLDQQSFECFKQLLQHNANLIFTYGYKKEQEHILTCVLKKHYFVHQDNHKDLLSDYLKPVLARMTPKELSEFTLQYEPPFTHVKIPVTPICYYLLKQDIDADSFEAIRLLAEKGAKVAELPDGKSYSPLFYLLFKYQYNSNSTIKYALPIIDYLLEHGEDINQIAVPKSNVRETLGRPEIDKSCYDAGAEKTGALTFMARKGSLCKEVISHLLYKGARTDIKDSNGKTCLDYVNESTNKEKLKQLYAPDEWKKEKEKQSQEESAKQVTQQRDNARDFAVITSSTDIKGQGQGSWFMDKTGFRDDDLQLLFPRALDGFNGVIVRKYDKESLGYSINYQATTDSSLVVTVFIYDGPKEIDNRIFFEQELNNVTQTYQLLAEKGMYRDVNAQKKFKSDKFKFSRIKYMSGDIDYLQLSKIRIPIPGATAWSQGKTRTVVFVYGSKNIKLRMSCHGTKASENFDKLCSEFIESFDKNILNVSKTH